MPTTVHDLVDRYAAAEAAHDATTLAAMATDDVTLVGPVGFVLDRAAWLRRFEDGLSYAELSIGDVAVREHGDHAVAVGVQTQLREGPRAHDGRPPPLHPRREPRRRGLAPAQRPPERTDPGGGPVSHPGVGPASVLVAAGARSSWAPSCWSRWSSTSSRWSCSAAR